MELLDKKRISVIVERSFRDQVFELLKNSGASGFTVYEGIYGKGKHGIRISDGISKLTGNLEIVSITGPEVANHILQKVLALIDKGVVMIVHVTDVKVIQSDHFD